MNGRRVEERSGRLYGDGGLAGGAESVPFGLLVLVAGALVVTNAWGVVDAKLAAETAARQGVRRYVEAADGAQAAADADAAARAALAALGRDPDRAQVAVPPPGAGFRRCDEVEVTVTVRVPRLSVPFLEARGGTTEVVGRHREIVDPFRAGDGLEDGSCP